MKNQKYHTIGTVQKIKGQNRRKRQNRCPSHKYKRHLTFLAWFRHFKKGGEFNL